MSNKIEITLPDGVTREEFVNMIAIEFEYHGMVPNEVGDEVPNIVSKEEFALGVVGKMFLNHLNSMREKNHLRDAEVTKPQTLNDVVVV